MSTMTRPNWLIEMPSAEYHAATKRGEYITSHRLHVFRKCPLEFRKRELGEIVEGDTANFALGRATHAFVIEGREAFDRDCIVADGPINPKTGKAFGRTTDKFREWAEQQTKDVVSTSEFALIEKMREAVFAHKDAARLLADGIAEGVVRTQINGFAVQARMDWYNPVSNYIVDLKTCEDVDRFMKACREFGYVEQLAFYAACVAHENGGRMPEAWIVAVEKKEPFRVAVYQIAPFTLSEANESPAPAKTHGVGNIALLDELAKCRETDVWPTRYEGYGVI